MQNLLLPDVSTTPWEQLPYLDRIWSAKQLPRLVRERVLELHGEGVLQHRELSLYTLRCFQSSNLSEDEGLQVLDSFSFQQVSDDRADSVRGSSQHLRVLHCPYHCCLPNQALMRLS
jgi:hypothetical protein